MGGARMCLRNRERNEKSFTSISRGPIEEGDIRPLANQAAWIYFEAGLAATLYEQDHLGNGPATMGPERTGSQGCLQWAHWTSRAAASLAPECVSKATEFFLRQ